MRDTRPILVKRRDKLNAVRKAEREGKIADSLPVRKAILDKVFAGQLTLEEAQQEMNRLKSTAKKKGLLTTEQVWVQG